MKDTSAAPDLRDVFGDIRSAVQQTPTKKAWRQLCALLDKLDDTVLEDELLPYLSAHLQSWPRLKRPFPDRWWERLTRGEHEPRAKLAGWRLLWGNMNEDEDEDDDYEDSDFSMYTALVTCALHPQLKSFLLADAAEWHHNGGDIGRFDAATGKLDALMLSNAAYHGEPYDSAYSPDGRFIAFGPVEEMRYGAVHVWGDHDLLWREELSPARDADEEDEEDDFDDFEQILLTFSHDSARLAYASSLRGVARVVDSATGATRAEITGLASVNAIALHPTLDIIAAHAPSEDGAQLGLWGADGLICALPHPAAYKLLFSRDGAQLAAASAASLAVFGVEPAALSPLASYPTDNQGEQDNRWPGSFALAALPDGGFRLAVVDSSKDGVLVLDTLNPTPIVLSEPGQTPESIAITHDGQHILCGHVARAWLWSL